MQRQRIPAGLPSRPPMPVPAPPWLMGMMIGMTIMTVATGAIGMGVGLALTSRTMGQK